MVATDRRLRYAAAAAAAAVVAYLWEARARCSEEVPAKMKQLVLVEPNANLDEAKIAVREVDVPKPKSGQVVVKMSGAPVNPSDTSPWRFNIPGETLPRTIGLEGSGIVVASGGGVIAGRLVGKKVGVVSRSSTYQQYTVIDALTGAFELDQSMPAEDAASFFVNPMTAIGIIDTAKQLGENIFIHTAAASQLGQMIAKIAPTMGVTVVCCVRRQEQADILAKLGVQHVVVEKDGWQNELKALIDSLKIKVAFDCIAGDMTGTLVGLLPDRSSTFVYGGLSGKPVSNIGPRDLIYGKKKVQGWYLTDWLMAGGGLKTLMRIKAATKVVNPGLKSGGWASSKFVDCTMEEMWPKYLAMAKSGSVTGQKLRIRFQS